MIFLHLPCACSGIQKRRPTNMKCCGKNHQYLQNYIKENVIVLCCSPPEPDLRYTKIFFPQHFMFVGLLFYIPEQAQDRLEIQNFQPRAAAEIWNWLLLLLLLLLLLHPSRDPHPMKCRKCQKLIIFC